MSKKNTLAFVAKHSRNIGSKDEPKWLGTRLGAAITTDNKDGALKVILNYLPAPNSDGTYTFMLYPPSEKE